MQCSEVSDIFLSHVSKPSWLDLLEAKHKCCLYPNHSPLLYDFWEYISQISISKNKILNSTTAQSYKTYNVVKLWYTVWC